ncbi:MAG TPA: DinB family protein [Candidatus Acidoferrales bacterium]|nr:DinB family protein [Candidatus Acidoferrales bacterium]
MKHSGKEKARKRTVPSKAAKGVGSADDKALREQLAKLLDGGQAHASWQDVVADIPANLQGAKAHGAPHTAWQLLEHMRIAQRDILEFSRNAKHVSPQFPEGYWPSTDAPPNAEAWGKSAKAFGRDLAEMKKLVSDPKANLFEKIAHGDGQTILREALLAADHSAYHLGQIVLVRKLLGAWRES